MKEKLIALIQSAVNGCDRYWAERIALHLIANNTAIFPCKPGDKCFFVVYNQESGLNEIYSGTVKSVSFEEKDVWIYAIYDNGLRYYHLPETIGINLFFSYEDAESAVNGKGKELSDG